MKTYDGLQLRTLECGTLMDDGGLAPALGESVMVDGRVAEVTASSKELINDSETGGRFIVAFKPNG